jgi:hypothetical protein
MRRRVQDSFPRSWLPSRGLTCRSSRGVAVVTPFGSRIFTGRSGDRESCEEENAFFVSGDRNKNISLERARDQDGGRPAGLLAAARSTRRLGRFLSPEKRFFVRSPEQKMRSFSPSPPPRLPVNLGGPRHERSGWKQPEACRAARPSDDTLASASRLRLGSLVRRSGFVARARSRRARRGMPRVSTCRP